MKKSRETILFVFSFFTLLLVGFNFWPKSECANSISCKKSFELNIDNDAVGIFQNHQVVPPIVDPREEDVTVLGKTTSSADKRILVDLGKQTLSAYDGDELFFETPISSGKWGRTPTGEFKIWHKVRSTRMTGGSGADYYDLPNVEYNMFFTNENIPASRGYAFHGAYWHNNFGHSMSHGCINMRNIDAKKLYEWVGELDNSEYPGAKIIIFDSNES